MYENVIESPQSMLKKCKNGNLASSIFHKRLNTATSRKSPLNFYLKNHRFTLKRKSINK